MAARKLVVYKEFSVQLAAFEEEYGKQLVVCDTPKGMTAAKSSRKEIRDTRSNLEDLRKETKEPVLAKGKQIDAEAKVIKDKLDILFNKFDTAIKAVENAKQIAAEKAAKDAEQKESELDAREAAIRAKEIELGLREPDEEGQAESDEPEGSCANGDDGSGDDSSTGDDNLIVSTKSAPASVICEPHIKAAAERLGSLRAIRNLVEPTDQQADDGSIDDKIAKNHDKVLAEIWEIVDEFS